jgi:hypothetical protein
MSDAVIGMENQEGEVTPLVDGRFGPIGIIPDGKTHKEIVSYLCEEIDLAESERSAKKEKWAKWRRQREAQPAQATRSKPWPNAANVTVPVSAKNGQNMFAYLKKTFDVRDHLIEIKATTEKTEDVDVAATLEKYLDIIWESPFDMDGRDREKNSLLEAATMGTAFVKIPYTTDRWIFKTPDETGMMKTVEAVLHSGPEMVVIPLEDLFYREGVQNLQRANWFSHRFQLTEPELNNRLEAGDFENGDELEKSYVTTGLESQPDVPNRIGISEEPSKLWTFHEAYLYWKLPGEDYYIDLIITFCPEARIIVKAEYNEIGVRPIEPLVYMHRPFFINGIGTGHMCEYSQDEVDTIRNMRLDNAHFANMRMLAVKRNSGVKAGETIFPGKIFMLDNPKEDIMPIQAGEIYPSSIQNEMMCQQDAAEYVGMPDVARGFADPIAKSGDTFSGQAMRSQKSSGLIDVITGGLKTSYSRIAMYVVFQLVRNREEVIRNERERARLSEEDISKLDMALSIKLEEIPKKLRFSVKTTEMDQTYEAQRQNTMTLVQVYAMFLEKVLPLASQLGTETAQEFMMKAFTGSARLMEQVFKFFGQDDTDRFIPNYKKIEDLQKIMEILKQNMQGGMNGSSGLVPGGIGPQRTANGNPGNAPVGGMGSLPGPV